MHFSTYYLNFIFVIFSRKMHHYNVELDYYGARCFRPDVSFRLDEHDGAAGGQKRVHLSSLR